MRNLKKFLALVLAMMMAMSLMVTANAATQNVTYPDDYLVDPAFEEAVTVLSGMGVFHGDNGDFKPGASITRAETAAIIYRLVTGDVDDTKAPLFRNVTHPFTDVTPDKWYAGYVGYLWNAGIIKGNTATTFNPAGNVTGYEALAMILRAVGYDKQNEFTGGNWVINVASIANKKGILRDVESTNYGGPMLYSAARRDVVASLLFNTAAYVPQVMYTSAFQYQETGMTNGPTSSTTNPTLGYTWFGLTGAHGVVLGNEATGEGEHVTKLGGLRTFVSPDDRNNNAEFPAAEYVEISNVWQWVPSTAYEYADSNNFERVLSFKWDTGLDLFGHSVKVWYDARDGANKDTYAMYDKTVATSVVTAESMDLDGANATDLGKVASENRAFMADTVNNWSVPNLKLRADSGSNKAYFNYAFSRMDTSNWESDGTNIAASPVMANKGDNANGHDDTWPLYLLISNSSDRSLDLVIALDMTFSKIVQVNNTVSTKTVGVTNDNDSTVGAGAGTAYFGDVANDTAIRGDNLTGVTATYVSLAQNNLVGNSTKTLGDKVAAIEITGTAGPNVNSVTLGTTGAARNGNNLTSTFYYQLTKPTHVVPGTVIKVDQSNQDVYLSDGSILSKSVFSEAVDATFTKNVDAPTVYKTYSFTLDNDGNYIYYEEPSMSSDFVYGTYIDYTTELASGKFVYPLVYVDANGQSNQTNITKVNGNNMDVKEYGEILLNKRSTSNIGDTSGYAKNMYVGYALNEKGELTEVEDRSVANGDKDTGFYRADVSSFGNDTIEIGARDVAIGSIPTNDANLLLTDNTQFYIVDGAGTASQKVTPYKGLTELMAGMSEVTINATSSNGTSIKVPSSPVASLENKDGTWLKKTSAVSNTNVAAGSKFPYDLIYFSIGDFNYAQNYVGSAREIKTIFIPADLIKFTPAVDSSLYFLGDSSSQIINAYGKDATLHTMYQNGQEVQRWIAGLYNDASQTSSDYDSDAYIVAQNGDNVFYTLVPTNDKAVNGETIYKIAKVNKADDKLIGQYYTGDTTLAAATDWTLVVGDSTSAAKYNTSGLGKPHYTPTTYSTQIGYISDGIGRIGDGMSAVGSDVHSTYNDLYNVGSAVVNNLNSSYTIDNLSDLNDAGSLANNYGIEVSCVLSADDSTGMTISYIYVNYK